VSEYVWSALRDDLIERWSDSPNGPLEQRILDVFERHPQLVLDSSEQIADRYARGIIRSPWPVLLTHVEKAAETAERADKPAKGERDKGGARKRAEQWMRTVGVHFAHEHEVDDELFGDFGKLRAYADDGELRQSMLDLWRSQRPRGATAERESEERQAKQGDAYRSQRAASRPLLPAMAEAEPLIGAHISDPFGDGE
jgi:predicted amidohydrolase YtcJ